VFPRARPDGAALDAVPSLAQDAGERAAIAEAAVKRSTVTGLARASTMTVLALLASPGIVDADATPGAGAGVPAERPIVANPRDVAERLIEDALAARVTADGTVFVGIEIRPDGSVVPREFYGVLADDPRFGPVVRAATAALRFEVPPAWRVARPDGLWAVFWMFQTDGCEADVYVAPQDVTTIRACVRLQDGAVQLGASDVRFDAPGSFARQPRRPTLVDSQVLPYPPSARRNRAEGVMLLRATLDARGRVTATEYVAEPPDPAFRDYVTRWLQTARFDVPAGWNGPANVRIAFGIARRDQCVWTLDRFDGEDVRICTGP
jgi:TonB family protein